ncbi:MAG: copper resistance protein CopC [Proteobacteria bacterium]|nr:copper resistance protein CopC [Pseudomonadota bacterium]
MTLCNINFTAKPLLGLVLLASLVLPMPVFAHAIMVKSQPVADSTIAESPKQVDAWFNDKVGSEYKALAVIDSAGKRVDNKDAAQETFDQSHLYVTIPQLPPGTYSVRYRVVSLDTHIVTGKFKFTIKTP